MIDAHVHAYPSLGETTTDTLRRCVGAAAASLFERRIAPKAKAQASRLWSRLEPLVNRVPTLDIERVADVRQRSGELHRFIESAASLALLPPVMLGGTAFGLLASMARHGVDKSVLIGSRGVASNDWILEAARNSGDRLVPVVTLPELDASATSRQWQDAYVELARKGARGFKLHPNWDGLDASHPAVGAAFEVAAEHGLFVILHTGCFHVVGYKSHGVDLASFEPFFAAFPRVRVCLAHMNRERPEDAFALMKRHEQLYADTSWQPTTSIARAIDEVGSDRIMAGSDWPLLHLELQGDARERAERAATGAALEDLLVGSATRFIGESTASARPTGETSPS